MHRIHRSSVVNMEVAAPVIIHTVTYGNKAERLFDNNDTVSMDPQDDYTADAAQIVDGARSEAARIKTDAWREGYSEGLEQGLNDAEIHLKKAQAHIEIISTELRKRQADIVRSMENEIIGTACDIAEKILGYQIDRTDDYLPALLRNAADRLNDHQSAVIRMCSADYTNALSIMPELRDSSDKLQKIELAEAKNAVKGDCIIEFENGQIDAGIATRMKNVRDLLVAENVSGCEGTDND